MPEDIFAYPSSAPETKWSSLINARQSIAPLEGQKEISECLAHRRTHLCPVNTKWDSSTIFHNRTDPSRPPAVTHRSRINASIAWIGSWCPNLVSTFDNVASLRSKGRSRNLQGFHIGHFVDIPEFDRTILRSTEQLVGITSKRQTLSRSIPGTEHSWIKKIATVTGPRWPRSVFKCWHVRAFQTWMRFALSPDT